MISLLLTGCGAVTSPASPTATPSAAARPSASSTAASTPQLVQQMEPSLPSARQETAATSLDGHLYVIGGYDAVGNTRAEVFVFDGAKWSMGPPLPFGLNHPAAAALSGRVYVTGGYRTDGASRSALVLDPGGRAWRSLTPMTRPRAAHALLVVGNALIAVGGRSAAGEVAVAERYNVSTDTWTDLPGMPGPRDHVAGFVLNGLACVAGGRLPATTSAVSCFDSGSSHWTAVAALPEPTSGAGAGVLAGIALVAGGEDARETRLVGHVEWLGGGSWTAAPMLVPRHGFSLAPFGGRLWACGGATAPGIHATSACTSLNVTGA